MRIASAAAAIIGAHPEVEAMRAAYEARAGAVVGVIGADGPVRCQAPDGGMFIMIDARPTGLSGIDFANRLLDEAHVAVMPGEAFGDNAAGHLRMSLAASVPLLEEAAWRIVGLGATLA